ncbi:hypothetical protein [Enterococcus pallens]|uniref:Uncharacterized protein n=1 Tax=Enterococcus pallens ATCC BAA-351 TaxID=1158607 RepID=R2QEY7_9ENTE|nr:hypothetical protein [Enterococcus pallens]EOH93798.1 hypothetical protein UAU_02494 [Enterococcus pallens ATCC BAA-351]EOU24638.1 hypothetical protein I588_00625 [Enterococcus pallens ATCC BAA-351]OJG79540.1 hypothetical protein RV10_GL000667 [Enterococcus pallens]
MKNRKTFFLLLILFIGLLAATGYELNRVHEQIEEAKTTVIQINSQ